MSLGVLSAAAGGRVKVWVRSTWQEPVNLYVAPALESGNRKSGVVREVTAPIREWERRQEKDRRPDVAAARSQRRVAEQALEHAEARAAKESDPGQRAALLTEAEQLARRLEALPAVHAPRLLTEDCTPERLAGLMAEQTGRMAILSPEGDVFDVMAGRYSSAPNFGIFLKGHAGDPHHVDRQGRPAEYIAEPALTIAVSPQPDVLGGLADTPSFRGRGLLARFLYSLPPSLLGRRAVRPAEMPETVRATYQTAILALLERFQTAAITEDEASHHYLKPDPEAAQALDDFLAWVEPQLGPHGELAAVRDWGGKLAGAVVRIAALLHLAERPTDPAAWKAQIPTDTVARAVRVREVPDPPRPGRLRPDGAGYRHRQRPRAPGLGPRQAQGPLHQAGGPPGEQGPLQDGGGARAGAAVARGARVHPAGGLGAAQGAARSAPEPRVRRQPRRPGGACRKPVSQGSECSEYARTR